MSPRVRTLAFWDQAIFWLLLSAHLLPVWCHRYFLTVDGPAHLYNAVLLKTMLLHPTNWAHQLLVININPEPNYLSHLLLVGLLTVLPPWLAEKLVVTLYLVGLPLALRYLLRAMQPKASWLAVLSFPLVYSVVLIWGFYNFCLSLVVMLWVAGYWLRQVNTAWSGRQVAQLAALLVLLFEAHPLSYLVSGLLLGLFVLATAAQRQSWSVFRRELGVLVVGYLPTLPLLGWYVWQKGTATSLPPEHYSTNFWNWLRLEPLRYFGSAERPYCWMLAALFGLLVMAAIWQLRRGAAVWPLLPWLVAGLLLLGAYIVLPDAISGGSIIQPRWGLLSYFMLLVALAAVPYPRWVQGTTLALGTLVALLLLGFRWQKFEAFQTVLAEYRSAVPFLRPHTTLAALTYSTIVRIPGGPDMGTYLPLFSHASGLLGVEANVFCYENYEAGTGYFPLTWRPGKVPLAAYFYQIAQLQPLLYDPAYRPTYLLLWGRTEAPTALVASPNARQIAAYIKQQHYQLRYCSPAGLLELYELAVADLPTHP